MHQEGQGAKLLERQLPWADVQRWHKRLQALEGNVQQLLQARWLRLTPQIGLTSEELQLSCAEPATQHTQQGQEDARMG